MEEPLRSNPEIPKEFNRVADMLKHELRISVRRPTLEKIVDIGPGKRPFDIASYARKAIKGNNLPPNIIQFTKNERLIALIFVDYFMLKNICEGIT